MRLNLIPIRDLDVVQKSLYDDMSAGIRENFKGFSAVEKGGELIGPWNPWLMFPKFGGPVWALVKALSTSPALANSVREVAILVTGAHFHAAYELYAHGLVAELQGLSDAKIATIVAGQRPADLTEHEALSYDMASSLVSGGVLPDLVYRRAVEAFGTEGAAELIYLTSLYCMVALTLNAFDVPVPEREVS